MKKRLLFLLILILPFSSSIFSQINWSWQNPIPQGNHLFRIQFVNSTTAYASGDAGTILKTTDSGVSWNITHYAGGSSKIMKSIFFIDESNGWAGGYDGKLLQTKNAGGVWDSVTGHSVQIIEGIAFPNPQIGVIATAYQHTNCCASIFFTTNGGTSWINSPLPSDGRNNLRDIAFANDTLGIAVGLFGNILRTTDGGATWLKQNSPSSENLHAIDHVGDNLWFIAGNGRIILKSTDSGISWIESFHGLTFYFAGIDMVDENTGYVCGYEGEIQKTTNGGLTWSKQISYTTNHLFDIAFSNTNNGIAVGIYGNIVRTTNGGATWLKVTEGNTSSINAVSFPSSSSGFTVGENGVILRTTNSGSNWQQLNFSTPVELFDVSFSNPSIGTAVGESGIIIKTTNGGDNWNFQTSSVSGGILTSVSFVDDNIGFAAGYNSSFVGSIIKTTNGGTNWTTLAPGITNLFYSIDFLNDNFGIAVGSDGAIVYTTNSGSSWSNRSFGFGFTFSSVQILTDSFVVLAGFDYLAFPVKGVVYISTDGGENWINRSNGITEVLNAVRFINESVGITTSINGNIFVTTDGGFNWNVEKTGTGNSLNNLTFIDPGNAITVGEGGSILISNTVIPVELISFTGKATGNDVILHWITSSELNNAGFEIERKDETNNFTKIGFVPGSGTKTGTSAYNYIDNNVKPADYSYRLKQIDYDGTYEFSDIINISVNSPLDYFLYQNYPNPFNPATTIKFDIPHSSFVTLKIYDALGNEIETLVSDYFTPGNYSVEWDADNNSSGIYFVKFITGNLIINRKMIFIK